MSEQQKINAALEAATQAFWAEISNHFPEYTSGDLSPETVNDFEQAAERAIEEWVESNRPDEGLGPR